MARRADGFQYYILDGHTAVPAPLFVWAQWFEHTPADVRQVAFTPFDGGRISTVFIGLDHQWVDGGPPLIFETRVFGGPHDCYQERYSTWAEADAGHTRVVQRVFVGVEQPEKT